MDAIDISIFTFLAVLAEVLGTVSGFGSSVFFVPIASYFFDFQSVLGITALFHIFSNLSKIYFFKKGVNWHLVIWLGIPAVIFVSVGAYLTQFIKVDFLKVVLALFLIVFSIAYLLNHKLKIQANNRNAIIGGTFSGFLAGLIGTGGAIRGMTLAVFNLPKEAFIATSAMIDFGVDFSRGVVYFTNGYIHHHDLLYVFILLIVSIIGTYIGKLILNKISEQLFKKIVLVVILGIGMATIINQFFIASQ